MSDIKLKIVRAQLGTALSLFILDRDPYSVHALACGASEVAEGMAETADFPTLSTHIMTTFPDIDMKKIKALRNQHWNALKHFYKPDGKNPREDEALLGDFHDGMNDTVLFMGWIDYLQLTKALPLEAQVFLAWWYAANPDKMSPSNYRRDWQLLFPKLDTYDRAEQKRRLRRTIEKYRRDRTVLSDPRTELGPLVMRLL